LYDELEILNPEIGPHLVLEHLPNRIHWNVVAMKPVGSASTGREYSPSSSGTTLNQSL
jgi:hypothetical protein